MAPKHQARIDFWAWMRFSASSHTRERGAVDHLGGDLFAAVGRQAVEEDGVRRGDVHQALVHLEGREGRDPSVVIDVAHGHPGVGDDRVGAGGRGVEIAGDLDPPLFGGRAVEVDRSWDDSRRDRRPRSDTPAWARRG